MKAKKRKTVVPSTDELMANEGLRHLFGRVRHLLGAAADETLEAAAERHRVGAVAAKHQAQEIAGLRSALDIMDQRQGVGLKAIAVLASITRHGPELEDVLELATSHGMMP